MGASSSQQTVSNEEKERDDIQQIQNVVSNIEGVIEGNPNQSLPELVALFSSAISVQAPQLLVFKDIVHSMKKNWNALSRCLDALGIHVDDGERQAVASAQREYWALLLKTRSVMEILVKKCEIQQRDIRILLEIIQLAEGNNGELSADDMRAHEECIASLGTWIQIDELQSLYEDWAAVCAQLEKQRTSWKQKMKHLKEQSKNAGMAFLKGLAFVVGGAALVSLIIFSVCAISAVSGGAAAAPAAAAGGAAVKTVSIMGFSLVTTHAVGIGLSAGALAVGTGMWGAYKYWERTDAARQAYANAKKVTTMLQKMIRQSQKLENEIKLLEDTQQKVQKECDYLKNASISTRRMKGSLCEIDKHLSKYIEQGQDVIKTVNVACKSYIK